MTSVGSCGTLFSMEEQTSGLGALSPSEEQCYGPQQRERPRTSTGRANSENERKFTHICGVRLLRSQYDFVQNNGNDHPVFIRRQRRQKKQTMLASAVFAHPFSLRHYCMDAYDMAINLRIESQKQLVPLRTRQILSNWPGILKEQQVTIRHHPTSLPCNFQVRETLSESRQRAGFKFKVSKESGKFNEDDILNVAETQLMSSFPLSVFLELAESACGLSIDALLATGCIGTFLINRCVSILCDKALGAIDVLLRVNPFHAFDHVLDSHHSAMGKKGDALASGIQNVTTGVGSIGNAALNLLSRQGLALAGGVVGGASGTRSGPSFEGMGSSGVGRVRNDNLVGDNSLQSKLFLRLQRMENVSKLVAYSEQTGEGVCSQHVKKRAQRAMHFNVSFRPFTATIQLSSPRKSGKIRHNVSFEITPADADDHGNGNDNGSLSSESQNSSGSIFMRTPTSFPPTPTSRLYYFDRGSRFTENVVFLARDQLRVERGVGNHNEQTRAMSKALIDGSRLAVFDAAQAGNGIILSCGQHIATKVGNALYCSMRSMIPVMRNSYVYFEISVSPSPTISDPSMLVPQADAGTLSIGLSTLAMPLDTLVGARKGSVGICSTGQILHAGQWFSPNETQGSSYESNSTVGCLVYLDDNSAYDSPEGQTITADVTFNINGSVVPSVIYNGSNSNEIHPESLAQPLGVGGDGGEPTLSLFVDKALELFPTVTLHSPATCVMCRFSVEDLLANSRTEIGALSGVIVYAVDGSVVLDESEEEELHN